MNCSIGLAYASIVRFLYTQNPFYLIGTLLVLVGLQQSFGQTPSLETSGLLTGLLAGYTLLLAAIAAAIIGYGRVWDDARTILLVIVLLFFVLSTSLDVQLISDLPSGSLLLALGLVFSLAVSETLLRGLGIHLAWRYRGPYYLLLALLFAWPILPAWLDDQGLAGARSWSLFAFPAAAAIALLTLWPAASTPADREPASGTPWKWPLFPWSLFVYLTIGIALRSWWLTISFDPASGTAASFRPYFLLPLVLAWSALFLAIGRARASEGALALGMLLPLTCVLIAFPGTPSSGAAAKWLGQLSATVGSPAQLAAWSLIAYYGWAWLRRVPAAEGFFLTALAAASLVGRETLDLTSLTRPQAPALAVLACVLLVTGLWTDSSKRLVAGGTLVALGALAGSGESTGSLWFWQCHGPLVALLAIPLIVNDPLAQQLRKLAWRTVPAVAVGSAIVYPWLFPALAGLNLTVYLGLLLLISLGLWQRERLVEPLHAALVTLAANLLAAGRYGYVALEDTPLAKGLPWLASGLALVATALAISLLKMGLRRWWQRIMERVNLLASGVWK